MTSSTSRDAAIGRAERDEDGRGLLARYRAGLLLAYPCAPDVACNASSWCQSAAPFDPGCENCGGSGRVPADQEDVLRLLAFAGVEEARALVPCCSDSGTGCSWAWHADHDHLDAWLEGISRLCAKLPARRVEAVACEDCGGERSYAVEGSRVHQCRCCGAVRDAALREAVDTPAERWLLVAACVAVGREICGPDDGEHADCDSECMARRELDALVAGSAWVEEPTLVCEGEWSSVVQTDARWVPGPHDERAANLQAAAEVLGEPRVRELVCAEVVRRVLDGATA